MLGKLLIIFLQTLAVEGARWLFTQIPTFRNWGNKVKEKSKHVVKKIKEKREKHSVR